MCVHCAGPPPPTPQEEVTPFDAALTDRVVADRRAPATTAPYPAANVTVTLPFGGPEQPIDLEFTAAPGRVDVHLLVDTTASFDGEIRELQRALTSVTLPALQQRVPSLTLGLSRFEDMPVEPFGFRTDRPFTLLIPQTSEFSAVDRALFRLDDPLGAGGDLPESWYEALYQTATGRGLDLGTFGAVAPFSGGAVGGGTLGGVGFRSDSTRVVVLVTDAPSHDAAEYAAAIPHAHSGAQAIAALRALDVRVVGIASGQPARTALESVAVQTRAVAAPVDGRCSTGLGGSARPPVDGQCPLVYDLADDGTGLSRTVADGIGAVLDTIAFATIHGEPREDGMRFVSAIEAVSAVAPANTAAPTRADRLPAGATDGVLDTFAGVRSGTLVRFRARLANRTVREAVFPQVFFLKVVLVGDGSPLRETIVRVIVPEGPKFDAGSDDGSTVDGSQPLDAPDAAETPDAVETDAADGPD